MGIPVIDLPPDAVEALEQLAAEVRGVREDIAHVQETIGAHSTRISATEEWQAKSDEQHAIFWGSQMPALLSRIERIEDRLSLTEQRLGLLILGAALAAVLLSRLIA